MNEWMIYAQGMDIEEKKKSIKLFLKFFFPFEEEEEEANRKGWWNRIC